MPGSKLTEAILENIESGRKADLNVSQLLNLSWTLGIPPSMILAPLTRPDDLLDLPNLGDAFKGVSVAELDSWLGGVPSSSYRASTVAERNDRDQLNTFRESRTVRREIRRLTVVLGLEGDSDDADLNSQVAITQRKIDALSNELKDLEDYLRSAGWAIPA